jgi:hypothetical protein
MKWKCWSRNRGSVTSTPFTHLLTSEGGTKTTSHNSISLPGSVPFEPSHRKLYKWRVFSSSTTNLTYSVSSLRWFIAIYHNSLQDSAHKKDNSRFYSLYIQPPTTQHCSMNCENTSILRTGNNLTHLMTFFNDFNLLILCNNHVDKCFHLINLVTLAYIMTDSLRMLYEHQDV